MRQHRIKRGLALVSAAALALLAVGGATLNAAQAQSAKKATAAKAVVRPNLNGVWVGQNITFDTGPETGLTANFTTTPWAALSKGKPEDVKFEPIEQQRERQRAIVVNLVDVFAPGARGGGPPVAYTPAGDKAAADIRAARAEAAKDKKPNPYDRCLPQNAMTVFGAGMEIFTANGHMGVLTDNNYRAIHLNADKSKYTPGYNGISVGHWEGDRLVVVTSDWLGELVNGWAHSDDAKVTETLWIDSKGVLNIKAVYEDKQYFKEPMARMMYLRRSRTPTGDHEFFPLNCVEGIEGAEYFDSVFGKEAPVKAGSPPAATPAAAPGR